MGLDCSHGAFHGAYSSFDRFRRAVCRSIGGSFPPHRVPGDPRWNEPVENPDKPGEFLDEGQFYYPEGWDQAAHPGLHEFFLHSDCDGEISPELCSALADEMEPLLPIIGKFDFLYGGGHIKLYGDGLEGTLRQFIAGCRAAAAAGEPLLFR